jgi:CubicO group peptidase (beta-lactamase class C family)
MNLQKVLTQTVVFILCGSFVGACASASTPTPKTVPVATNTSSAPKPTAIPEELISEVDAWLGTVVDKTPFFSGSVLVASQDGILLSKGYGLANRQQKISNTPQTRYRIGSITKQFTAMAILILETQGKLKVVDPVCMYFADCPSTWKAITIHHLLTHTAGLPEFTNLRDNKSTLATASVPVRSLARFKDLPLEFAPGEKWVYCNSGYIVLGYIIEQVSKQPYEEFLKQSIFTPLGMGDTGYDHNEDGLAIGYPNQDSIFPAEYIDMLTPFAAGGLYSTVEDLYKWDQALYTEKLVPQASLDKMFAPQFVIPDNDGISYGYGWFIGEDRGWRAYWHEGSINGFYSMIVRYPDIRFTMVILSNQFNINEVLPIQDTMATKFFGNK